MLEVDSSDKTWNIKIENFFSVLNEGAKSIIGWATLKK